MATKLSTIPGGAYTAERTQDGKWNVYDVPVFAEIPKGERGNREAIDHEWQILALKRSQERLKEEKFLPPLHVYHHDGLGRPEAAGHFRLRRVGKLRVAGGEVYGTYADLIAIPDAVFARIEKGELPYRSAEVFDWEDPEINELALLPTETPFFRFEMLTIGEKIDAGEADRIEGAPAVLAVRRAGKSRAYLFSFRGEAMPIDNPAIKPDGEEPKKPEGDAMGRIEAMLTEMGAALKAVLAAIAAKTEPAGDPAMNANPAEPNKLAGKPDEEAIQMKARVLGLEAKLAAKEKADTVRGLIEDAGKRLTGWHVSEEMGRTIAEFAALGKDALGKFVTAIQENVPKDDADAAGANASAGAKTYPAEVLAYAGADPAVMEEAEKSFRVWKEADAHGIARMSAARWLEINVGKAPAKK